MAIEIFRAYVNSDLPIQDGDHIFSIIASDADVAFAAPQEVIDSYGLTQERIDMAKNLYTASDVELPTTPTDWAILASTNMSQISVIPFDVSEPYDTIEQAVIDETSDAQDALEVRNENQSVEPVTAAAPDECPPATQDIPTNLANREKAIKDAAYGPLNPAEPNEEFWQEKATRWSITPDEAKKSRCGNCVMFIRTTKMKDCIAQGIEQGGSSENNAWDAVDAAELGYCEAFDFKCAASRTCNAWVAGGPIDDSKAKE
jgi:hypothetical protein